MRLHEDNSKRAANSFLVTEGCRCYLLRDGRYGRSSPVLRKALRWGSARLPLRGVCQGVRRRAFTNRHADKVLRQSRSSRQPNPPNRTARSPRWARPPRPGPCAPPRMAGAGSSSRSSGPGSPRGGRRPADRRVVTRTRVCSSDSLATLLAWPALDDRRAEVLRDRLAAGVEDVPARPPADHRRQDRQRAAELRPHRVIGAVHQQERAGLNLGHAVDSSATNSQVPVPAAGDDLDRNAGLLDQPPRADQLSPAPAQSPSPRSAASGSSCRWPS